MRRAGVIVIVNACIWGFVILMTAHTLKGTEAFSQIEHILGGGAAASLLVVAAGIRRKQKD